MVASPPVAFPGLPRIDLRTPSAQAAARFDGLVRRSAGLSGQAHAAAATIVEDVRTRGDAAVIEATERFEGRRLSPETLRLAPEEADRLADEVPADVQAALAFAAERIRAFHAAQPVSGAVVETADGRLESRVRPLARVAVYAPGGTAAYPSSVLMCAIPAAVAGVDEIVLLTPRPDPVVLAAAKLAGVGEVLRIGGAQGVAAVAFGTETIRRVDKIVGPGNAYVTAAKRLVYGHVDVDGIAGPSEIVVVAAEDAAPACVAADLLAQAEHDREASAVCVTWSEALADAVDAAVAKALDALPRRDIAAAALRDHGACILVRDLDHAVETARALAPEHLELLVPDAREVAARIDTAGAIFVGPHTPEAAGDYTAGPSHVLPTAGAARFGSPLGVYDFVKYTSVLELTAEGLARQAPHIVALARTEGLEGHARSVLVRGHGGTT